MLAIKNSKIRKDLTSFNADIRNGQSVKHHGKKYKQKEACIKTIWGIQIFPTLYESILEMESVECIQKAYQKKIGKIQKHAGNIEKETLENACHYEGKIDEEKGNKQMKPI